MTDEEEIAGVEPAADPEEALAAYEQLTFAIAARGEQDPVAALEMIGGLSLDFREATFDSPNTPLVLLNMTSVLINLASDLTDEEALGYAVELLDNLIEAAPASSTWISHARYNRANARENLLAARMKRAWEEAAEEQRQAEYYKARALVRSDLRASRRDFLAAAQDSNSVHRTQARTNLGNMLSTSGRWLEAFEQYAEAVAIDPTNGNAAGNAAASLHRALSSSLGPAATWQPSTRSTGPSRKLIETGRWNWPARARPNCGMPSRRSNRTVTWHMPCRMTHTSNGWLESGSRSRP
ncbi:hypothetical protein [Blastococcus sp. PRF04-17]|uniref:hypothetical protein n=1 Tax=Blastococcus sp. PRF04-17 TaxID=2933797 RepID=UPI001FF26E85|nr:hypothetical protein [Blastococcus sp. PRF04-17]UOY03621.1 hypothetical protein MVA48_09950 [Blastococcus sp. PRF04-17]